MIGFINRLLTGLFDLLMWPCRGESPWPGLVVASLFTAAVLVGLFQRTSNQRAILRARNRFLARTLELLLFQHDLRVSLTACGRLLAANVTYLFQFLIPLLAGLIPLLLIFVQMEAWFDRRPLYVGEKTVLTVKLDPAYPVETTPVEIALPETARVDAAPVRSPVGNELAWRIIATQPGDGNAAVTVAGITERKSLAVGLQLDRLSPRRQSGSIFEQLWTPSEPALSKSGPIRRIEIDYPPRELAIGLTAIPWIVAALLLMMAFSLLLGQLFGVRIA